MKVALRVGDTGTLERVEWRVVQGAKGPDDQILQLRVSDWAHVPMSLGLLMAQFFFDNEERIYPQAFDYRGGWLYLDVAAKAALRGWPAGAAELVRLRTLAEQRRQRGAA